MNFAKNLAVLMLLAWSFAAAPAAAQNAPLRWLPPETTSILDKIYGGDAQAAIEAARRLQRENPQHPLGYALEAEAEWWDIWGSSAEYKYGMTMARHRGVLAAARPSLELA